MPSKPSQKFRPSITAKIDPQSLAEVLRERNLARKMTHLLDHSVPETVRLPSFALHPQGLRIQHEEPQTLSPFVIHLNTLPEPKILLEQEAARLRGINFLHARPMVVSARMTTDEEVADLALSTQELEPQYAEDDLWSIFDSSWTLPRLHFILPFSPLSPQPERIWSPDPLPFERLVLPQAPANLLSTLELPEMEDEKEDIEFFEAEPAAQKRVWHLWMLPKGWQRAIGVFVLLSFVFVLPIHAMNVVAGIRQTQSQVDAQGQAAIDALASGAASVLARDPANASDAFGKAVGHFDAAQTTIRNLGATTELLLAALPPTQKKFRSGRALLQAGKALARAGARISESFTAMDRQIDSTPTTRLATLESYFSSALPDVKEAEEFLKRVDIDTLPEETRATFRKLQTDLPRLRVSLEEFLEFSSMASIILGGDTSKRYLLIFQNNTELRATGGFIGSFAEVKLVKGEVNDLRIPDGGTYDLQGQLREFLKAPKPLQLLKARWEFQDANWFPDFPSSARKLLEFYSVAGGPTVDGVIAVNATFVANLLRLLGPIDMPGYGRTMTADNFLLETQKIVEREYDRTENKPKAFIGDLAPKLLDQVMEKSSDDFFSLLDALNRALTEKDIQVYFRENDLERQIRDLGWGGDLKPSEGDYLLVVNSNLGGGKTDAVISEKVDLNVAIGVDGSVTNTMTLSRTHLGAPRSLFTGVNNVDYVRLYVPKGSQLLAADGFTIPDETLFENPDPTWHTDADLQYSEQSAKVHPPSRTDIFEENGFTVFGNWIQTKPGTTSTATFTYRLPQSVATTAAIANWFDKIASWFGRSSTARYTLTLQKQPGVMDRTTTVRVSYPETFTTLWSSDDPSQAVFTNRTDQFFSLLFETRNAPSVL